MRPNHFSPILMFKVLTLIMTIFAGLNLSALAHKSYVRGVDVSHWQGDINWGLVASNGIRFALIKASQGKSHQDPRFEYNTRQAKEAGLLIGAYHYLSFCTSWEEQIANYANKIKGLTLDFPPIVDIEHVGNCEGVIFNNQIRRNIVVPFLTALRALDERPPIIYLTGSMFHYFHPNFLKDLAQNVLWLGHTNERQLSQFGKKGKWNWTFLQYSSLWQISGIKGPVDLNYFKGTEENLINYIRDSP